MAPNAIGFGSARSENILALQKLPAFRKATRAMMLSTAAVEAALKSAGVEALLKEQPELFALLSASSFGELETTKDFLKGLADTGVARPMLFQNSLHNSTTGFLCIQYKISAPALTFSHGCFAGEQALQAADLILTQGLASFCIVATVDTFIAELLDTESDQDLLKENSGAVILATNEAVARFGLKSVLKICGIRTQREAGSNKPSYAQLAGAQADVIKRLEWVSEQPTNGGELKVEKPTVGFSTVSWARP